MSKLGWSILSWGLLSIPAAAILKLLWMLVAAAIGGDIIARGVIVFLVIVGATVGGIACGVKAEDAR